MNPTPETRPTRPLADGRVALPTFVPARVIRFFESQRLQEVESVWSPVRKELGQVQATAGFELESSHWNWLKKIQRAQDGKLILVAVECENEIQGLMAIPNMSRPSILTPGKMVLYVDYLEAAPWNQRSPHRPPRFLGAGSALIAEAIAMSIELGLNGRVGLHSLPQATAFYALNCRMSRLGIDSTYYDLEYFEYAEGEGPAWLAARTVDVKS